MRALNRTNESMGERSTDTHDLPAPINLAVRFVEVGGETLAVLSFDWVPPAAPLDLTAAERAVFVGLVRGDSNAEIARERGTSMRTVANQVASIFRKAGVHSRSELLAQ